MRKLLLFLFVCCLQVAHAQNLVPNPSFEDYTACPNGYGQIHYATGWDAYLNTPEYYNSCSISSWGVPNNVYGYQLTPNPNCTAYAGLINYNPWSTYGQELIGRSLNTSLTIGQKYFLEMKVSLANFCYCATNNLGFLFSTVPYNFDNPVPINNFAHYNYPYIVADTTNWTLITGSFIADSAYQYIIIGIFFDLSHTDTIGIQGGNCNPAIAYYYIDDICVSTDSTICNPYLFNCITGIPNAKLINSIKIYPNPTNQWANIN